MKDIAQRQAILSAVRDAAIRCGAQKAVLFGSWARDTATRRSDIDAVFVEETPERYLNRLDKYLDCLWESLGKSCDVFVYTPAEFARMARKPFGRRVLREGVVAYER
jgi:predicted nucleotidyltransferase